MEIWQYIGVLRQPKKYRFFLKSEEDNFDEKINALAKLADKGSPTDIYSLVDFLKDRDEKIRHAVCDTIIQLFQKIDSKKAYYNALKYCKISQSDIKFYKSNFSREQYVELLAISSLNENGYVREKAVIKLADIESPRAIQFLIYRLADWVHQVRQEAINGIKNYKSAIYIDALIENLPIFAWLQKVERTNLSGIYQDVIEYIATTNRDIVVTNFRKYPDKLRLLLAKHISDFPNDQLTELNLFLTDRHFLIRSQVLVHFNRLEEREIHRLLNDKSAKVRLQTLYCLKEQEGFELIVENFLADYSAMIRHFARFALRESAVNCADIYNENLKSNRQVIGSLAGLAELEANQYKDSVKRYLTDSKLKFRRNAFLALSKLDKEAAYEFGLANLDSIFEGIRNQSIDCLSSIPRKEVLVKAREIYQTGNYELKKSMLKLFNKIGGLVAIPDIMYGTIDENENIRQIAFDYLRMWKDNAARMSSMVKQNEIEKALQTFRLIYSIHEDKQYFNPNPLEGLDFYLN
jgi:HEAT repeat protein